MSNLRPGYCGEGGCGAIGAESARCGSGEGLVRRCWPISGAQEQAPWSIRLSRLGVLGAWPFRRRRAALGCG